MTDTFVVAFVLYLAFGFFAAYDLRRTPFEKMIPLWQMVLLWPMFFLLR